MTDTQVQWLAAAIAGGLGAVALGVWAGGRAIAAGIRRAARGYPLIRPPEPPRPR
jgi:hypothetical protein